MKWIGMLDVQHFACCAPCGHSSSIRRFFLAKLHMPLGLLLLLLSSGCAAPFAVNRLDPNDAYQQSIRSALGGDVPSNATLSTLRRFGLLKLWKSNPEAAIGSLRSGVVRRPDLWREWFALAELSYLQGKRDKSPAEYLAAAVYAYAFLDPGGTEDQPSPFDERFLQACDIYNLGLAWALTPPDQPPRPIVSASYELPFGHIVLMVDPNDLQWRGGTLTTFQTTADLAVKGLDNVYSSPGLGDPLAAQVERRPAPGQGLEIASQLSVPTNLLMIIDHPRQQAAQTELFGRLVIHTI